LWSQRWQIVIQTGHAHRGCFLQMKRLSERLERFTGELESRLTPILSRVQIFLEDTQPKISEMVADASPRGCIWAPRAGAKKSWTAVFTEAADRLRGQLVRADHILTGALEAVEDAGSKIFAQCFGGQCTKCPLLVQGI